MVRVCAPVQMIGNCTVPCAATVRAVLESTRLVRLISPPLLLAANVVLAPVPPASGAAILQRTGTSPCTVIGCVGFSAACAAASAKKPRRTASVRVIAHLSSDG